MAEATLALMTAIGASSATAGTAASTVGAIGSALPTIAGVATAGGAVLQGVQANAAAKAEAKRMKAEGDEAFATGQRKAMAARRQKDLVASRAKAVAAASGAGAEGGSVDAIMEGIEQQGEYNATVAFFEGNTQRQKMYANAASRRQSGKNAMTSSYLRGATSFYDTYSRG